MIRKRLLRLQMCVLSAVAFVLLAFPATAMAAGSYTWSSSVASGGDCYLMNASDDGKYAICGGNGSTLVTTNDFGATWTAHSSLGVHDWVGVSVSATGQYMAGTIQNGSLLLSTDYGATFTTVLNAGTHAWANLDISANGQYIAAVADLDNVMISANGGTTWSTVHVSGVSEFFGLVMSNSGQYMYAADSGSSPSKLYRSTDFGATWALATSAVGPGYIQGMAASPSGQHIVATSTYDKLFVSHDYGATWSTITTTSASVYNAAISADGQTILAPDVNPGNLLAISYDGGVTWQSDAGLGGNNGGWWNIVGSADLSRVMISPASTGEVLMGQNPALIPPPTPQPSPTPQPANISAAVAKSPSAPDTGYGQPIRPNPLVAFLIVGATSATGSGIIVLYRQKRQKKHSVTG